jgi:hypothetical protein
MIGLKELALVVIVVLVLYGRSGVLKSRRFQSIWPWIAPVKRQPRRPRSVPAGTAGPADPAQVPGSKPGRPEAGPLLFRLEGNRLFWFLTILAATAVAALVVTRLLILKDGGAGLHH